MTIYEGDKCKFEYEGEELECEVMYIEPDEIECVVFIETEDYGNFQPHCGRLHVLELKKLEKNNNSSYARLTPRERNNIFNSIPYSSEYDDEEDYLYVNDHPYNYGNGYN